MYWLHGVAEVIEIFDMNETYKRMDAFFVSLDGKIAVHQYEF